MPFFLPEPPWTNEIPLLPEVYETGWMDRYFTSQGLRYDLAHPLRSDLILPAKPPGKVFDGHFTFDITFDYDLPALLYPRVDELLGFYVELSLDEFLPGGPPGIYFNANHAISPYINRGDTIGFNSGVGISGTFHLAGWLDGGILNHTDLEYLLQEAFYCGYNARLRLFAQINASLNSFNVWHLEARGRYRVTKLTYRYRLVSGNCSGPDGGGGDDGGGGEPGPCPDEKIHTATHPTGLLSQTEAKTSKLLYRRQNRPLLGWRDTQDVKVLDFGNLTEDERAAKKIREVAHCVDPHLKTIIVYSQWDKECTPICCQIESNDDGQTWEKPVSWATGGSSPTIHCHSTDGTMLRGSIVGGRVELYRKYRGALTWGEKFPAKFKGADIVVSRGDTIQVYPLYEGAARWGLTIGYKEDRAPDEYYTEDDGETWYKPA